MFAKISSIALIASLATAINLEAAVTLQQGETTNGDCPTGQSRASPTCIADFNNEETGAAAQGYT